MTNRATASPPGSLMSATIWMIGLGILIGWIPVVGPAVAGFVGGRKAGEPSRAIAAALIPAVLVGVAVGLILGLFELPVLGTVTGVAIAVWIAVETLPMLVFAAVGGWTAEIERGGA